VQACCGRRDLWAAHDHDAGWSRHHQRLDNLIFVRSRYVREHHAHNFFINPKTQQKSGFGEREPDICSVMMIVE
jgi:hypothetical protein